MGKFRKSIFAVLLFFGIQVVLSIFVALATMGIIGNKFTMMLIVLFLSFALGGAAMFWPMRMLNLKSLTSFRSIGVNQTVTVIIAAICGIFGLDVLSEVLDLPNLIEAQMGEIMESVAGMFVISVLGPIAEELVFRGAIISDLKKNKVDAATVIGFSAAIFGIIHLNPAQIPFAAGVGVILGLIYYRTNNIYIVAFLHILNNSVATLLSNVCSVDAKISDLFGSTILTVVLGLAGLATCYILLCKFWNETKYLEENDVESNIIEQKETEA